MAYAFGDDKSKKKIVTISGSVEQVSSKRYKTYYPDLEAAGIDDITKYTVIGIMQSYAGGRTTAHYIYTEDNDVYPCAQCIDSSNALSVLVYNSMLDTRTINFQVVLMEI